MHFRNKGKVDYLCLAKPPMRALFVSVSHITVTTIIINMTCFLICYPYDLYVLKSIKHSQKAQDGVSILIRMSSPLTSGQQKVSTSSAGD